MVKRVQNAEYGGGGEEEEEEFVDGDEEEESSDDEEGEEEVLQQEPRPNAVYNSVALHERLEEIGWPEDLDWVQTLCVSFSVEDGEIDVNDDLAREMAFYTQALEGTRDAYSKLLLSGTPFLRPPDYYAEMVKSDSHMLKVKDMLLSQKKDMEEADERRKAREAKRFSKEVQAQKLKQRAQEKKQNIESVKKWRKMRQDSGFDGGEDEFPVNFDDDKVSRGSKKRGSSGTYASTPSKKLKGHHSGPFDREETDSFAQKAGGSQFGSTKGGGRSPGSKFGSAERGSRSPGSKFGDEGKGRKGPFNSTRKDGQSPGSLGGKRAPSAAPWDRSGGKGSSQKPGRSKSFQKRQSRDAKYGHGGKKSFKKANTAESSAGFGSKRSKHKA
eukprot:c21359_g1_i2 orf=329-1480(-)